MIPIIINMQELNTVVSTFYKFVELENYYDMKTPLLDTCNNHNIKGTILLAHEGINATISGNEEDIRIVMDFLKSDDRLSDLFHRVTYATFKPFERMKVRLKNEIVRLNIEDLDACTESGEYLSPAEWDQYLKDPNVIIIDTRNDYEISMGHFKNAINPYTSNFRNLIDWADKWSRGVDRSTPILMYCTGGIRCEKSTSYIKRLGFSKVYHLQGGILNYLEKTKNINKNWIGNCFVFDDRVAVDENLVPVSGLTCRICNTPVHLEEIRNSSKGKLICTHCAMI